MPDRIQLSRRKGWRMPENTVKVDRTTPWGNPFIAGTHGTRAYCVDLYRTTAAGRILVSKGPEIVARQMALRAHVATNLESLRGKNVACWCSLPKPGEPDICHAAVLLDIANGPKVANG